MFTLSAKGNEIQRTKSQLLLGEELVLTELLDLRSEDLLRGSSGVNARSLDRDEETTTLLQEELGVDTDNSVVYVSVKFTENQKCVEVGLPGLIGLGNIGEDDIDHGEEHAVSHGLTGILDDRDDVGAAGSHVDEITAGTVGELDGVDGTSRANNIGNVGNGGTGGSTEVEDLGAGLHVDGLKTTEDTGSQLRTERVPDLQSPMLVIVQGDKQEGSGNVRGTRSWWKHHPPPWRRSRQRFSSRRRQTRQGQG